jgi:hypothetical protein
MHMNVEMLAIEAAREALTIFIEEIANYQTAAQDPQTLIFFKPVPDPRPGRTGYVTSCRLDDLPFPEPQRSRYAEEVRELNREFLSDCSLTALRFADKMTRMTLALGRLGYEDTQALATLADLHERLADALGVDFDV